MKRFLPIGILVVLGGLAGTLYVIHCHEPNSEIDDGQIPPSPLELLDRENSDKLVMDFSRSRFKSGSSVEEFIVAYPPYEILKYESFTYVDYFPPSSKYRLNLIAINGKLVYAKHIIGEKLTKYFDTITEADRDKVRVGWEKAVKERVKTVWNCQIAVCGAGIDVAWRNDWFIRNPDPDRP